MRSLVGGSKTPFYRAVARSYSNLRVVAQEGLSALHRLEHVRNAPPGSLVPISMKTLDHPMWMRTGTNDAEVVIQNAVRDEWGFAFGPADRPRTMIDGGAFIGDTAAVFLSRFPELFVLALEPDTPNHVVAERNLAPYGERVKLLKAAVWHEDAELNFGGESWGAGVKDDGVAGNERVEAIAIARLIDMLPGGHCDILKLDIEGAEQALFANDPDAWLDRVDTILIELHSPEIKDFILPAMQQRGYSAERHRASWVLRRPR